LRKYFVSGVGPGEAGASRFFMNIEHIARSKGYSILYPYTHKSLRGLWVRSPSLAIAQMFNQVVGRISFYLKLLFVCNSTIFMMHPQGIGFLFSMLLIGRNKEIRYYVLDNSYFCLRSYNYHKKGGECMKCVGFESAPYSDCRSFPGFRMKIIHRAFMFYLKKNLGKITFYCQNKKQIELLELHFGLPVSSQLVGMLASDTRFEQAAEFSSSAKFIDGIDGIDGIDALGEFLVFHGSQDSAKGIDLSLKLAEQTPKVNFVFPFSKPKNVSPSNNCVFIPCRWESGLNELVERALGVLCLSQWSAPVEGALIKSLYFNGAVIVSDTRFGFSSEIPNGLTLKVNENTGSELLSKFMKDESGRQRMIAGSKKWISTYSKSVMLENMFDES